MADPHPLGTITPDAFRRIRAIFEAALDQPLSERPAFVEDACAGDTVIRAEVERMLAAEATGDALLDQPPAGGAQGTRHQTPSICASCRSALSADDRFCRQCGTPTHPSAVEDGRFRPGTLFANRFRIVARLGRGGMGEVYRADDLELGQPVALKFLRGPAEAGHYAKTGPPEGGPHINEGARTRLRSEVRLARQISHPNVCRVYDIGDAQDELYLSMEYVDGEDLASLAGRCSSTGRSSRAISAPGTVMAPLQRR